MSTGQPPPDGPADAPDKEKMEQIRMRRLAKLGSNTSQSRLDASASASSPAPLTIAPSSNSSLAVMATQSTQADDAHTKLDVKALHTDDTTGIPRKRAVTPSGSAGGARALPGHDATSVTTPHQATLIDDHSADEWADKMLSQIFRVSVDPIRAADIHGHRLTFLADLSAELRQAGEPLRLSTHCLDSAIMEATSLVPSEKPLLSYLYPCWARAVRAVDSIRPTAIRRKEVVDEAKRLCVANCLFAVTMPTLFNREPNRLHDSLMPILLGEYDIDDDDGRAKRTASDFISNAILKFNEDDSYENALVDAMVAMLDKLTTLTMNDDYKRIVEAILLCSLFPPLLRSLARHPRFQPAVTPNQIEKQTLFGPLFRLSPVKLEVCKRDFPTARTLDRSLVLVAQESVRLQSRSHQSDIFTIVNAFIRADADTRNRTLDWFAYVLNVNHKRRAMQVDPQFVSSDGFMMNVTAVLDRFCEPFMDNTFSKVGRIELDYLRRRPRVDILDETKLNADVQRSQDFYNTELAGTSNFISEIFFLTLAAHHYGNEAAISKLKNLEREIKHIEKELKLMEVERPRLENNPHHLSRYEENIKRHIDVLDDMCASKYAIEGVLLDEHTQALSLRFMRYVAVWLLRVASKSDYTPEKSIKLPLDRPGPEEFHCLPEYALQNIVENFKFIFRFVPNILNQAVGDEMIALCVVFLESSEYIKNPYLKSSLVSLLYYGTMPFMHRKKGVLGDQLISLRFANDHLLHALIKFYIECESTGAHTQFFDKFNIRYEIFQVMKCVWVNDIYKDQLKIESKVNTSFFVHFVNLLLNDATFVLDEALSKFPKIQSLELELERARLDQLIGQDDREKKEEELQALQSQATSYMQLANETLAMMRLFTKALMGPFTMPEIVSRLASMLNYNLETLAGPKAGQLKVTSMEQYHFRPVLLLSDFVEIYLNLGSSQVFIEAIASDGRSFRPETMERAGTILEKRNIRDPDELRSWRELLTRFRATKTLLDQAEIDLGEIPPDFEDPIMGDLMRDPVILPSKQVVDRSTIVQHLLSDPKDPFTRQPMTAEDVVPDVALKERIDIWKAERMALAKARLMGDDESMELDQS